MSMERRIDLNVSVPDFRGQEFHTGGQRQSALPQPDAQAKSRFDEALAGKNTSEAQPEVAERVSAPNPFSLFGSLQPPGERPAAGLAPALSSRIGDGIERLMVDDGSNGNRQVRMELKDDLLPGVTVALQELEGRLQVDFICSNETSRLRLNEAAPSQAQALAERLRREVLLRVQTDDPEDLCLTEALAAP